jgi:hypothetical protein
VEPVAVAFEGMHVGVVDDAVDHRGRVLWPVIGQVVKVPGNDNRSWTARAGLAAVSVDRSWARVKVGDMDTSRRCADIQDIRASDSRPGLRSTMDAPCGCMVSR